MTDSELLALAARAHGDLEYVPEIGWIHVSPDGTRGAWWNPLKDDADAFRLVVKLCLLLNSFRDRHETWVQFLNHDERKWITIKESHGDNDNAATRRAIVRAAAEIGKEAP